MNSSSFQTEIKISLIAKAIAITAVVGVHLMSLWPDSIYTSSEHKWFFLGLNQLTRFSVPLFLALSGYGLAKKYQHTKPSAGNLLLDRFKKLVPLYLLWSAILLLVFQLNTDWSQNSSWWRSLFLGGVDYHLYFVPLILQLYLLFALLPKLINRKRMTIVLIGTAVLQLGLYAVIRWALSQESSRLTQYLLSDQSQYRIFVNWLYYFSLGVFASQLNLVKLKTNIGLKLGVFCLIITGFGWAIFDAAKIIQTTGNTVYATGFVRMPVFIFATGVILAFILYGYKLLNLPVLNSRLVELVGRNSYLIYLSHTLALRILDGWFNDELNTSTLTLASVALVAGTFISSKFSNA